MSDTPEPGWLHREIERAKARSEKVPAWARPVLIDKSANEDKENR